MLQDGACVDCENDTWKDSIFYCLLASSIFSVILSLQYLRLVSDAAVKSSDDDRISLYLVVFLFLSIGDNRRF